MLSTIKNISKSLILHISNRLNQTLESYIIDNDMKHKVSERLMDALLSHEQHSSSNKCFMEAGILVSKALLIHPLETKNLNELNIIDIDSIIRNYNQYLADSKKVYDNIQSHHRNIIHDDWHNVTKDKQSLAVYSNAAAIMGTKLWIIQSIEWITDFAVKYYHYGGAKKYYLKTHVSSMDITDTSDLIINLMYPNKKIRLLDIGSCYNPLKKSNSCDYFDITAIDLYPADDSVLQCDFLNLLIGHNRSKPIINILDNNEKHIISSNSNDNTDNINPLSNGNEIDDIIHYSKKHKSNNNKDISTNTKKQLLQLPSESYDVIIISLVLSYLPTSEQRIAMIRKARQLLVSPGYNNIKHHNGLLLIVEKQSIFNKIKCNKTCITNENSKNNLQNQPYNATITEWIQVIESIGFQLLRYENYLTKDSRKSHIFIFSTVSNTTYNNYNNTDTNDIVSNPKLSIKSDFESNEQNINL